MDKEGDHVKPTLRRALRRYPTLLPSTAVSVLCPSATKLGILTAWSRSFQAAVVVLWSRPGLGHSLSKWPPIRSSHAPIRSNHVPSPGQTLIPCASVDPTPTGSPPPPPPLLFPNSCSCAVTCRLGQRPPPPAVLSSAWRRASRTRCRASRALLDRSASRACPRSRRAGTSGPACPPTRPPRAASPSPPGRTGLPSRPGAPPRGLVSSWDGTLAIPRRRGETYRRP